MFIFGFGIVVFDTPTPKSWALRLTANVRSVTHGCVTPSDSATSGIVSKGETRNYPVTLSGRPQGGCIEGW